MAKDLLNYAKLSAFNCRFMLIIGMCLSVSHCGGDSAVSPLEKCHQFTDAMYQKAVSCNDSAGQKLATMERAACAAEPKCAPGIIYDEKQAAQCTEAVSSISCSDISMLPGSCNAILACLLPTGQGPDDGSMGMDPSAALVGTWRAFYTSLGDQITLELIMRPDHTYSLKQDALHGMDRTTTWSGCRQVATYEGTWKVAGAALELPAAAGTTLLEQCDSASDNRPLRSLSESELADLNRFNLRGTYDITANKVTLAVGLDAVLTKQ